MKKKVLCKRIPKPGQEFLILMKGQGEDVFGEEAWFRGVALEAKNGYVYYLRSSILPCVWLKQQGEPLARLLRDTGDRVDTFPWNADWERHRRVVEVEYGG